MKKVLGLGSLSWSLVLTTLVLASMSPRAADARPRKSASAGAWRSSDDPRNWGGNYEYRFEQLPLQGDAGDHTPWSDTYWPNNRGGIADRWNQRASNAFKYSLLNEAQVRAFSHEQLAMLSPAEKYDIFMGRFDYPTVRRIRDRNSPRDAGWAGICHGWSPAALNHREPEPKTVMSAKGVAVPFGSADIKALLDQHYADHAESDAFLGARCNRHSGGGFRGWIRGMFRSRSACNDLNPGAFHLIMANELGLRHQGFVGDVTRYGQVWNQPIYAFTSKIVGRRAPSKNAAHGTVREVLIRTSMTYALEIAPRWFPVLGTQYFNKGSKVYDYALHLDAKGRIIGGEYYLESNLDRPDFLWRAPRLEFTGYASGIQALLND